MKRHMDHRLAALLARAVFLMFTSFTQAGCGAGGGAAAGDRAAANAGSRPSGDVQLVDACELIAQAELDRVLGAPMDKPRSFNMGFDDDSKVKYSSCTHAGADHGILLKLTFPYWFEPTTSEAWAAKVRDDYAKSVEGEEDPEIAAMLAAAQTHALDGLGVVAAWIDMREIVHQVVLHAIKDGRQRTYLELYAPDLEVARQVAEKLLPALP